MIATVLLRLSPSAGLARAPRLGFACVRDTVPLRTHLGSTQLRLDAKHPLQIHLECSVQDCFRIRSTDLEREAHLQIDLAIVSSAGSAAEWAPKTASG